MRRPSRCGRCGKLESHDSLLQSIERTVEYFERGRGADYIEQRKEFVALGRRHLRQAQELLAELEHELCELEADGPLPHPPLRMLPDLVRNRLNAVERALVACSRDEPGAEVWLSFARSLLHAPKLDRPAALAFLEGVQAEARHWPASTPARRNRVTALLDQLGEARQLLSIATSPPPARNEARLRHDPAPALSAWMQRS
jgi:hypothetical protein